VSSCLLVSGSLKRAVATGVSDNFTRADSAITLGTSSSGIAWSQVAGTMGISTNRGYVVTSASPAIATLESGKADATWSCTLSGDGITADYAAMVFRYSDASNFWAVEVTGDATRKVKLYKIVAGVQSNFIYGGSTTASVAMIVVVTSGNSITVTVDGSTSIAGPGTDSFNATATKIGFLSYGTNQKMTALSVA